MGSRHTRIAAALCAMIVIAGLALALWAAPGLPSLEPSVRAVEDLIRSWGPWGSQPPSC
jgi:hypothetical protein